MTHFDEVLDVYKLIIIYFRNILTYFVVVYTILDPLFKILPLKITSKYVALNLKVTRFVMTFAKKYRRLFF